MEERSASQRISPKIENFQQCIKSTNIQTAIAEHPPLHIDLLWKFFTLTQKLFLKAKSIKEQQQKTLMVNAAIEREIKTIPAARHYELFLIPLYLFSYPLLKSECESKYPSPSHRGRHQLVL